MEQRNILPKPAPPEEGFLIYIAMNDLPTHSKQERDFPNEIWEDIGFGDGAFSISTYGRVYSNKRTYRDRWGNDIPTGGKFLTVRKQKGGNYVHLTYEKTHKNFYIPTLMADCFMRDRKENECVMHVSKNKYDDRIDNLKIVTWSKSISTDFEKEKKDRIRANRDAVKGIRKKYSSHNFGENRKCTSCLETKPLDDFTHSINHGYEKKFKRYKCNHCEYIDRVKRGAVKSNIITKGVHGNSKLHYNDVLQIRSIYDQGIATQKEIMDSYSISRTSVHNIVHRKSYKYL